MSTSTKQTDLSAYVKIPDTAPNIHESSQDPESFDATLKIPQSAEQNVRELNHTHGAMPEEDTVSFPFSWIIGERLITTISALSSDESVKAKVKGKHKTCSLCGSEEIEYTKENRGFAHQICTECATRYVRNACALKRRELM